jgi:hypothetical protein
VDGRLGACAAVGGDEVGDREVGEDVAVGDDERLADPGVLGGEADRARRVQRLGLDRVPEPDTAAVTVGSWPMSRSISGTWATGSIDLGMVLVSGRSRVPKPPTSTTACIGRSLPTDRAPAQRADERLVCRGDGSR